jgi:hypothetical protein
MAITAGAFRVPNECYFSSKSLSIDSFSFLEHEYIILENTFVEVTLLQDIAVSLCQALVADGVTGTWK